MPERRQLFSTGSRDDANAHEQRRHTSTRYAPATTQKPFGWRVIDVAPVAIWTRTAQPISDSDVRVAQAPERHPGGDWIALR
jgi:hypothetical protein